MAPRFISIRDKFTRFVMLILIVTMVALFAAAAVLGITGYRTRVALIREEIRNNIIGKGKTLVANNSLALRPMTEENAFMGIRELVGSTVTEDADVNYGIFMDGQRRCWALATRKITIPKTDGPMSDTMSLWADSVARPSWKLTKIGDIDMMEFAAPVRNESGKLGVIRYGLSTNAMNRALAETRREAFRTSLIYPVVFVAIGLALFYVLSMYAGRQANTLTRPLHLLMDATQSIAAGDYSHEVILRSNDEVGLLASAFETMRATVRKYTANLEEVVAQRTAELREAQKDLVTKAHRAGMADIATATLHNVGNILNSVKTSVDVMQDILDHSSMGGFTKANQLLRANDGNIEHFFASDPRAPKLVHYYLKLEDAFKEEYDQIRHSISRLAEKVNAISEVIMAQQNYAGVSGLIEEASLVSIVEDALVMQSGSIQRYNISIVREYEEDLPKVMVERTKLIHVLINMIKNAKEAMLELPPEKHNLTISISKDDTPAVYIRMADSGCGIGEENITRIFNHGFTTKPDGHGFGLHSSANYMKEMGAQMWAISDGKGKGATFILKFTKLAPLEKKTEATTYVGDNSENSAG